MRLLFPVAVREQRVGVEKTRESLPQTPLKILTIDDEPLVREMIKEMLEGDGHSAEVADGGKAGIEAFFAAKDHGRPFDLVITDLGMPYVHGRQVIRQIKERSPETPVILLSGWGAKLHADDGLPREADAIMSKPVRLGELREAMGRVRNCRIGKESRQEAGGRSAECGEFQLRTPNSELERSDFTGQSPTAYGWGVMASTVIWPSPGP